MKRPVGFDGQREPASPQKPQSREVPVPPEPDEWRAPVVPIAPEETDTSSQSDTPQNDADEILTPQQVALEQSQRAKAALKALKAAQKERRQRERGERRRFTRWSRVRRKRWLIALAAIAGLAAFVAVGVLTPLLNLQKITVIGAERLDSAAIVASLETEQGVPLALIDESRIREKLSEFSLIQEYAIEIVPPHELVVRIVERSPVLTIQRGERFDLVDPAGVVIETTDARVPGFPIADALVVDVNSPSFRAAAQSLSRMQPELAAQVNIASATTDQDVSFTLTSGLRVIWGSSEQSVRKSVLVNTMMKSLAGRPVSTIDVSSTETPVFS